MTALSQPGERRTDYLSLAQFAISGLGMGFSLLAAGLLFVLGLVALFNPGSSPAGSAANFNIAWIALLGALLAAPSLGLSFQTLRGKTFPLPRLSGFRLASLAILAWPLVLVLGNLFSAKTSLAWLALPPLQILAVGLPVWWIIEMARRNLSVGSRQRGWGLVNFSLFITTPALMVVEMIVILGLALMFALWVSFQPELVRELQQLAQRLSNGQLNPDSILPLVQPYLRSPLVIYAILALMAGLFPMIEELIKPLAVWFLAGRRLTPPEGFVAGALCGGAFALVESLFYLSNPLGEGWAALAIGRSGTCLLHITTTALLGWALASAWQENDYLRLGLAYLLSATLHGLWNALSILTGFMVLLPNPPANLRFFVGVTQSAPVGLVFLVLILFA